MGVCGSIMETFGQDPLLDLLDLPPRVDVSRQPLVVGHYEGR